MSIHIHLFTFFFGFFFLGLLFSPLALAGASPTALQCSATLDDEAWLEVWLGGGALTGAAAAALAAAAAAAAREALLRGPGT